MFRLALRPNRVSRPVVSAIRQSRVSSRPVLIQHWTRFNSTQTPPAETTETDAQTKVKDPRKAALEARDDMQRDWDARILSYAEVKPRTEQPTPVRRLLTILHSVLTGFSSL